MSPPPRQIFVSITMQQAHFRRMLLGCREHVRRNRLLWDLVEPWGRPPRPSFFQQISAAILQGHPGNMESQLRSRQIPFVQVSGVSEPAAREVCVLPDNRAIGRVAAEYFLHRGFHDFAFVGIQKHWYSRERLEGFRAALDRPSLRVWDRPHVHPAQRRAYNRWLGDLLPGTALFCANDILARTALRQLLQAGRLVPEEVSVVGVDDDEIESALSPIPISSVDTRGTQIGIVASELLDNWLKGEQPPPLSRVSPGEVIGRASSDILRIGDPLLARLMARIRAEACDGLTVSDLLPGTGVSRRTLERRFLEGFGRGIEAEIRRVRLEHARILLRTTNLRIGEVAERAGFEDIFYFSTAFKKEHGASPAAWRKQHA